MKYILLICGFIFAFSAKANNNYSIEECKSLIENRQGELALPSLLKLLDSYKNIDYWEEDEFEIIFILTANIYSEKGNLQKLDELCKMAGDIFNQMSRRPNTKFARRLWMMSGQIQMELKDYETALRYLFHVQKMYEVESIYDKEYFAVLTDIGTCYLEMNDVAHAHIYLKEAEEIHRTYIGELISAPYPLSFKLLNSLGQLSQRLDQFEDAKKYYNQIINAWPNDPMLESIKDIAKNNLAIIYTLEGKYREANETYRSISMSSSTPSLLYKTNLNITWNAILNKDYEDAIISLNNSNYYGFQSLQNFMFNFSEVEREYLWTHISDNIQLANNCLAALCNSPTVLTASFEINSFIRDFNYNLQQLVNKTYTDNNSDYNKLLLLNNYQNSRARLSYGFKTVEEHDSIARDVIRFEREILSDLKFDIATFFKNNYNIQKLKEKLTDDDIIIDFIYMSGRGESPIFDELLSGFYFYVLSPDYEYPIISYGYKNSDLTKIFDENITDAEYINNLYKSKKDLLYKLLIDPLIPFISGKKNIYLRPYGLEGLINLDAIEFPNGKRFGEQFNLNIVTNFERVGDSDITYKYNDIALFGDPNFYNKERITKYQDLAVQPSAEVWESIRATRGLCRPLPATKKEIDDIDMVASNGGIKSFKYLNNNASESSFKELSGHSPSILHLATHGFFLSNKETIEESPFIQNSIGYSRNNQLMLYSGLLLAGANEVLNGNSVPNPIDDGILTADEISRMDLSNTDLVVLSACETGKGHFNGTDGIMGLQRAFRDAGAKTMVLSLWQIPDEPTALLMKYFYNHLFQGRTVRFALKEAQQDIINDGYIDPYYWASFIVLD